MAVAEQDLGSIDGVTVESMEALSEVLGWHDAAVFEAGVHRDGGQKFKNLQTAVFVLADPWPEYKLFSFEDGELVGVSDILAGEVDGTLEEHLGCYGSAEVVALSDLDCIERSPQREPTYVGGDDDGE
jgi:hypothetical protein